MDEGLPHEMQTGCGADTVKSLQNAIKMCVKNKDTMAVEAHQIEVYALGINKSNYEDAQALGPDEKLPQGSSKKKSIFVHVPREKQDLSAERRRLYGNRPPEPSRDPIEVGVRCSNGKQFHAMVNPKHKIVDLKKQFEQESGVPYKNQFLFLEDEELLNQKTAGASGIEDGDIIDLLSKTIELLVRLADGNTIPVTIRPSQKIKVIKEFVAAETGIEVSEQILTFKGEELASATSVREGGLEDGDLLELQPNAIQVIVQTPDGNEFPVTLYPSDTIQFIKEEVEEESGIEVPLEQVLSHKGKELMNNDTAKALGLRDGSFLNLEPMTLQVHVRTPDENTIAIRMYPGDPIKFIKEGVQEVTGIEVEQQVLTHEGKELPNEKTADELGLRDGTFLDLEPMAFHVYVRTQDGNQIPVSIFPLDNIQFIKEEVAPEVGIEAQEQVLKLHGNELPNKKSADDMGLIDGSILDLEPALMEVNVRTPKGKIIPVTVRPSDPIEFIKEEVAPGSGVEVSNQVLTYMDEELPDDITAEDAVLIAGCTIDLQPAIMQVHVRFPDGSIMLVTIRPSDPIEFIKEDVAPESGIEVPHQVLTYLDEELANEVAAKDAGLTDGCTINLQTDCIVVHLRKPDEETMFVRIKPHHTIGFLKEQVAPETGIEVDKQILSFNGHELPDYKTADDVGLKNGSTLHLIPREMEVQVVTPHGEILFVEMDPSDTIQFIKEYIQDEKGIEVPSQILKFNSKTLCNDKTAAGMDLKHGSVIDLTLKYTPTPFDMSKNRVFYQLGKTVPYYIRINGWEGVGVLKKRIMDTRGKRKCEYLNGVTDPSTLQVYNPDGNVELGPDEDIPANTSFEAPLLVCKEGDRPSIKEEENKVEMNVQSQVKERIAARRRVSCS